MNTWRTKWVSQKKEIALRLSGGGCGGSYGEAMLVLCAALSALAAEVWPGIRIDQRRFVELLKEFAPTEFKVACVSIPLLESHLRQTGRNVEARLLWEGWLNFSPARVITGDEVDCDEAEILRTCNSISLKEVRRYSYANLLYGDVRSGYAHEYRPGARADSWPMTSANDPAVSYVNRLDLSGKTERLVHFHVQWVADLAVGIAKVLDTMPQPIGHPQPSSWWVDG